MAMNNPIIKKPMFSVKSKGPNECPCCGYNTNLLKNDMKKVDEKGDFYCLTCDVGRSKKKVAQKDFYLLFFNRSNHKDAVKSDAINPKKSLPSIEVAHLCGGRYDEYVYMDMHYDLDDKKVFFRLCCSNDDEDSNGWDATETFQFISLDEAIAFLNINDIHFFDGYTEESVFEAVASVLNKN